MNGAMQDVGVGLGEAGDVFVDVLEREYAVLVKGVEMCRRCSKAW